jgi:hypothetical protein
MTVCFSGYVLAAAILDGRPAAFRSGESTGYFLWQDKDGLHIRAASNGTQHSFSGNIRTDGEFRDVFSQTGGTGDYCRVSDDREKIAFWFTAAGNQAGIDLRVRGGTYITFKLSMDGEDAAAANIFVGKDGWHPDGNKFTLQYPLDRDFDDRGRTVIIVPDPFWWGHDGPWHGPWHGPGPRP